MIRGERPFWNEESWERWKAEQRMKKAAEEMLYGRRRSRSYHHVEPELNGNLVKGEDGVYRLEE